MGPRLPCHRADGEHKLSYVNRKKAKAAAKRNERLTGTALRIYRCTNCTLYHTTSRDPHVPPEAVA